MTTKFASKLEDYQSVFLLLCFLLYSVYAASSEYIIVAIIQDPEVLNSYNFGPEKYSAESYIDTCLIVALSGLISLITTIFIMEKLRSYRALKSHLSSVLIYLTFALFFFPSDVG
ncbi:hypothetical protein L1077_25660 [Pseudoalteromonas luteoviolacea]|uniref:hypothetical protein n=1 Tax=Pseudoalteromonas luteoviolacea TaxID=43657 RepID=UPI001F1C4577|nr:hypothetical protein [Pseudoalteromonas luteoviolacea]MCF6442815.1 hypothetical protein [Pseudoalteromonas luteoviolacea]